MFILQFTSVQRFPLLHKLSQRALQQESTLIFDLEDTLSDSNARKSSKLKAWGRSELILFAKSHPRFFENRALGIRVNSLNSNELEHDLDALAEISKNWDLQCIVCPKVGSTKCVQTYLSQLEKKRIRYRTFIPIVETAEGMEKLPAIFKNEGIREAIYGHYDYSLESRRWPFLDHDETEFWEFVTSFITTAEKGGIRYIHPPVAHLNNEPLFGQVLLNLKKRCRLPFGIMTISSTQTAHFNRLLNSPSELKPLQSKVYSESDKIEVARYVLSVCSSKRRQFGFDPRTGKFFSPHHLAAATRFLKTNAEVLNQERS